MPPKKRAASTKVEICPICEEAIAESSASRSREEAILRESSCGHWLHRCAGLSKAAFVSVSKSSSKFCCPLCRLGAQEKEIEALRVVKLN